MPELPEVETVRQTLRNFVLNHRIEDIEVLWPNMIDGDVDEFKSLVKHQTIREIERKGKYLIFIMDDLAVISHLRMEGKFLYEASDTPLEKHSHVIFHLDRQMDLRYHDVRKFGRMEIVDKKHYLNELPLSKLGPEPFDLKIDDFKASMQNCHLPIKTALLDQTKIAGLGNIYANEVLYRAGIHPMALACDLSKARLQKIIDMSCEVLSEAIQMGGTTIRSFSSNGIHGLFSQKLDVHGRDKEVCHRCGHLITKRKSMVELRITAVIVKGSLKRGEEIMISFGILGLGNIAHRFSRSLIKNSEAKLYAVASSSEEKQQQFKELYGAEWSTSDYHALIKNPKVDVVYIATQHKDHAYWVKECLLEKKAVICEKPMTLSKKETIELICLAKKQGVFLMEALKTYFIPGVNTLIKEINSGIIGDVMSIEASFESNVPYIEGKYLYEKGQGGALNDVVIYPLSFVLKAINEPITNIQVKYRQHPKAVVDSYFEATFDYASHKKAIISGAIDFEKEKKAIIRGTKGWVEAPYYYRVTDYTIHLGDETIKRHIDLDVDDMQGEINEVIHCIKNNQIESQIYTFEKMLEIACIHEAIREQVVLKDE